jgi:hypothetical protein
MAREKLSTSFRLTPKALALIETLAKKLGTDKTSVIELAVRELAERKGLK